MKLDGVPSRTIWLEPDGWSVGIIDQTLLPHKLVRPALKTVEDAARAIKTMQVRGAPLIGVAAAYGVALAMRADASDASLDHAIAFLGEQRPTAVNLRWALEDLRATLGPLAPSVRAASAYARAAALADDDIETCRKIGVNGLALIQEIARRKGGRPVNVLTHCNAGWLACVDWGTATSPIYHAHDAGIPVHVWVDETRPRNQGAALTAFELLQHGVAHSLIADNAGGHFMQHGDVDLVIVGTDRVTANGDVANKIGTYLKALAAHDTGVPFYVALPYSTIDWRTGKGCDIPIEERSADEVLSVQGRLPDGSVGSVLISAEGTHARNPAFDVTPARLVTGFITERGICAASGEGLLSLYPEKTSAAA
ncbi:S-methyl-5-thioribose-1-phosphate isomerase [Hyphomicrobium sp.]|jgi:methylthioribose-1-phosphate isomerase|uniref:S-methyl-5-thioribose-1-phosphate isomerase n=1 Tax=Hyphomicrobium sp. TaxID=82 RepID=UPI0035680C21